MSEDAADRQRPPTSRPEGAGVEDSALLRRLRDQTFRTLDGKAFVDVEAGGGRKIVPIQSRLFRQWLGLKLEEETGERPSQAELRSMSDRLESYASDAPVAEVYVRVALAGDRVFIDLADNCGRVVEVGPEGWNVIDTAPVHFIRPASSRPLPVPEKGGSIEDLRSLINVADDGDFVLIVASLLDALRNGGAHPVLVINGGEGTAKSTLVEILRELIDPSWALLGGLPQTERQLLEAGDGYLRVYDNVSSISAKISDALCRMSTGRSGHPIIINGIGELVMQLGLADRCLFVNLALVSDRQRRSQQEIRTTFEKMRPRILGVLLDAVAHGLRALPTTRPDALPRMADFAIWATACEGALWPAGTFMAAYLENRTEAAEKLIETDVVAMAVRTLMVNRPTWSGTATELDGILRAVTGNLENANGWPAEPRILSARLRSLAPSLNKVDVTVTFDKVGHNRTRIITISGRSPDPPTLGSGPAASSDEGLGHGPNATEDAKAELVPEMENAADRSDPAGAADAADAAGDGVTKSADGAGDDVTTSTPADGADDLVAADVADEPKGAGPADDADDKPTFDSTRFGTGLEGAPGPRPPPRNPGYKHMEPQKPFGRQRGRDEGPRNA
jgi:hypothetical protein